MKKILLFASALAGLFLAASCQQEMLSPAMGGDANVTFNVAAGDVATKADIADGTNVDILYWEIYGDINQAPLGEGSVNKTTDKHFTVELKLVADQHYTIIFWAEVEGKGHYVTDDLRKVAINTYADEKANDETRAAFFAVYSFDTENGESIKEDIYLYRPFSQINLGATTYETSFNLVQGGLKVESTEMTVNKIANVFNTITGMGETEGSFDGKVTFKANDDILALFLNN